jgi:nitrogen fixation protein NifZ
MASVQYDIGDMIFATEDLFNDGGLPELAEDGLIAAAGTRGVVVNYGHVEADQRQEVYLVRFEGTDGILGPPVGCLPEELTQDEAAIKALTA